MIAILGILGAVLQGAALPAVLTALTASQWLDIAELIIQLAPEGIKLISAIHPAFTAIVESLNKGASTIEAAQTGQASLGPHYHGGPKTGV